MRVRAASGCVCAPLFFFSEMLRFAGGKNDTKFALVRDFRGETIYIVRKGMHKKRELDARIV